MENHPSRFSSLGLAFLEELRDKQTQTPTALEDRLDRFYIDSYAIKTSCISFGKKIREKREGGEVSPFSILFFFVNASFHDQIIDTK